MSERRVVIVAVPGHQPLDVLGPHEVFRGATDALAAGVGRGAPYAPVVAGARRGLVRSEGGLAIEATGSLASLASSRSPIDTLIVAGGRGARRAIEDRRLLSLVRRVAARSRRVASVCTGAYVLAAAGLLDGKRASTHWAYCDDLARRFPAVAVERDPIYVRDGSVWTSAGVTAGIDLALAMVEADLGRDVATTVARWMVVFVRRAGGQSQFSAQLAAQAAAREPLRDLQSWVLDHPSAPLDVPSLARRAGMSVRNFARAFRAETGLTPGAYVERARLDTARRLLETSSASVEEIARRSGFGTPESLRRAFVRRVGLAPREYRSRFGRDLAAKGATP